MTGAQIAVLIPLVAVCALNESDTALDKTAGHQALSTEVARLVIVQAVRLSQQDLIENWIVIPIAGTLTV